MTLDLDVEGLAAELGVLRAQLGAIDEDEVKKETARRIAEEAAKMVRQAVFESSIRSPADKISPYEGGPGPALATSPAWIVEETGKNTYTVSPHPQVRQRAHVLNYGYPGKITPTTADYMRFTVNGVPVFRKEVDGPDPVGYWEAAFRRLEQSGKIEEIAEEVLEEEVDEKL